MASKLDQIQFVLNAQRGINQELHGRPDCKSCALAEIIQEILDEYKGVINAEVIRAIVVLSQMNAHIWYNESAVRAGTAGYSNLGLTHGINGIRNTAKNKIQEIVGGRKDYKIDCLAAEFKDWEISWTKKGTEDEG